MPCKDKCETLARFMKKYNLRNESTSALKIMEVVNDLKLEETGVYLRNEKLNTKQGLINLDTKEGTHWVCYHDNNYFDSFGINPPTEVYKQLRPVTYSTFRIQSMNDSKCASYCLYILYLIAQGFSFERAVLKLFFEK